MSEYEKQKPISVSEQRTINNEPDEVEITVPLAITHGDDSVEGGNAVVLDWSHIHYVDDIHVEGEAVEDYAVVKFNAEMKTAKLRVKGDFVRDGSQQFVVKYGKTVSKLGEGRL